MENPFLQPYTTPHGTVPFDKIELVHYEPAIREGISQEDKEINDIISNPEKPTFKNNNTGTGTVGQVTGSGNYSDV